MGFHGALLGSGGGSYDDTAVLSRLDAAEATLLSHAASLLWNRRSSVDGTAAGNNTSVTVSNLDPTKRNLVVIEYTNAAEGGTGAQWDVEFEPALVVGDGDSSWARLSNAGTFGFSDTKSMLVIQGSVNMKLRVWLEIDPVNKKGFAWYEAAAGAAPAARPSGAPGVVLQWAEAAITSFRLTINLTSANNRMADVSWKGWTWAQ